MLERFINARHTADPGQEDPAATRQRLKDSFPAGAARRMTQLGMLVGNAMEALQPRAADAIVYVSRFGESRALEAFLDSFPAASPTLFQTSIHPSGVQQGLIARQRATPEVFPMAGSPAQVGHALLAALLAPAARSIVCGGEERATWLTERRAASERTFAFAIALEAAPTGSTLGHLRLEPREGAGTLELEAWFDVLHGQRAFTGFVAPGWHLTLNWTK